MKTIILVLRGFAIVVLGYATIVVGAVIFQDWMFGGLAHTSPPLHLIVGGGMTAVFAVLGGYLTYALAPNRPGVHAGVLVGWLCIESTLLAAEGTSPLWFDGIAGASVILSAALGAYLRAQKAGFEERASRQGAPG